MDSVKYIFAKPDFVQGVGNIYPISMNDFDEFMKVANVLTIGYERFEDDAEFHKNLIELFGTKDLKLLDQILVYFAMNGLKDDILNAFNKVFSFICKQNINYSEIDNAFINEDKSISININNYELIREVVLNQNLIFLPEKLEDEIMNEWYQLALEASAETSLDMFMEDMITTIVVFTGIDFDKLLDFTIYQVNALFQRIIQSENYKIGIMAQSNGSKDKVKHFAERINMHNNPYSIENLSKSSSESNAEDSLKDNF